MNWRQQTDLPPRLQFFLLRPLTSILRVSPLALALCLLALPAAAKVTNSIANGDWSLPATWDNGVPADGDQISIGAAHTVTLSSNVNFTLAASTLTVNGTLDLGTFTCRVTTTTVVSGGSIIQNTTSGLPVPANLMGGTLTLQPGSNYSYTGNPTGFTGLHPNYGNLNYASTAAGNGTFDVNLKVAGNMTINNSGAGEVRFGSGANHSHTIGGTLNVAAGNAVGTNGAANVAIDINGNFTIANTATFKACVAAGNLTVNLAGNFTQNGTLTSPGTGIFNLIFDGNSNATVNGSAALTLFTVSMSKTGGANVALTQHLTISKNLSFFSGRIQTGNFNLTQAAGATIIGPSGATGYVETNGTGKFIVVQTTSGANFPIGNSTYTPMSLVPSLTTSSFGARVVDGFSAEIPGCSGFVTDDAVKKMWIVTRETGTATIMQIELHWNGVDEGSSFNRNLCGVVRYLGGDWEIPIPNTATGSDPYFRDRLFSGIFDGTFGILDNNGSVNLSAPAGISNSPVCAGQILNLQRSSAAVSGATYQWSKQGGGFNPPAGPNASINPVQLSDTGNYVLTMTKYGCSYTSTFVPVAVNPLPVCDIQGDIEVCTGTSGHNYSAPPGMSVYAWSVLGNGSISGPSNAQTVSVNAGTPGSYTLALSVTDAHTCVSICTLQVTVLPRPTGLIKGDTAICLGQSAPLFIQVTGAGPWSGTLSDGTPFGGSTSPITVLVTPGQTTTYTIGSLTDQKCVATPNDLSGSAKVTIDSLIMFQVKGGGSYCAGGDGVEVSLSGSESDVSYQLFLDGNPVGDPVAGTGAAISFGNQTGAGTYTVVGTRTSTECEKNMTGSVTVSILPLPVVTLELVIDQAAVTDSPVLLSGGNPPGGTYSGPGVSGNMLDPFTAGIGEHQITYAYTDNNGCSNFATDTFTVNPVDGLNLLVEAPDSAQCGEKFFVDVVAVTGFTDLGTLQFNIAWDHDLFMLMGTEPTVIDGTTPLTGLVSDTLVYSWLDENDDPYGVTLPDDTVLLRLTFKPLQCNSSGKVTIEKSPRVIEASDKDLGVVPVTLLNTNEISVYDTQPPVFSDTPSDMTVECSAVPDPGTPSATDNCDPEVEVTYQGQSTVQGNCANNYTITRTWIATDDCGNTSSTSQVITVHDTTPPTFTAPADMTISLDENCEFDANSGGTGTVSNLSDNCNSVDSLKVSFTDEISSGAGSTKLVTRTWFVTDQCGNSSSGQTQLITAVDTDPPTISCPGDASVVSGNMDCIFTISGTAYDPVASDNCGVESVDYTLSGSASGSGSGSLDGILLPVGGTTVVWTVTDINGLTASCSFVIKVQDCTGLSGRLIWEHDDASGVAQSMVTLSGDATGTDGPTGPGGDYLLIGGTSGNFVITPDKASPPADPLNGVTAADAIALQKHLLNILPITDPYKLIAGDVNFSNSLNGTDASIIRQAVLGSHTALEFFVIHPWRFVPTPDPGPGFPGYTPPANPFSAPIPASRTLTGVAGGATNQNFFGIKVGDVNGSANPNLHPTDANPLLWIVEDQSLMAGQEIAVTFRTAHFEELAGYQFALKFDPAKLKWLDVETAGSPLELTAADNFGWSLADQGEIRTIWTNPYGQTLEDGTPVFTLRFRALQSGTRLSDILQLKLKSIPAEAYPVNQERTGVELVFSETTGLPVSPAETAGVRLLQNRPNPFAGATTIGFMLPDACEAQLRILDATGRELMHWNQSYAAGYHEEQIRLDAASATGILYYELTTPYGQLTRRMVIAQR